MQSTTYTSKFAQVIGEANIPDEDRNAVALYANFLMNTDRWRPSDAARYAVEKYRRVGAAGLR